MSSSEHSINDTDSPENGETGEEKKKKCTKKKVENNEEDEKVTEESNGGESNTDDSQKENKEITDENEKENDSDLSDFCYQNKFRFKTNSIELQKKSIMKNKLKDKTEDTTEVPSSQKGKKTSDNTTNLTREDSSIASNKDEHKIETIHEKTSKKEKKSKIYKKNKFDAKIKSEQEIKLEKKLKKDKKSTNESKDKGDTVCLKTNEYETQKMDSLKKNKIKYRNKKRESNVEYIADPKEGNDDADEEEKEIEKTENEVDSNENDPDKKKKEYWNLREAEMKINEKLKMIHMLKKEKIKCSEMSPLDMIKQHGKLVIKIDQIYNDNTEEISFLKNELVNLKDEVHKLMNIVNMSQKVVNALK